MLKISRMCGIISKSKSTYHSPKRKLKVLFFGTDLFALSSLKILHQEYISQKGCVSNIEACCAKMKDLVPPVKAYCDNHQIVHHDWPPCTTLCQEFDIGVVSSFGHLIPSNIIDSFHLGTYNVHGSLLPKYRGAAPIIHALLNGDSSTGVTIMEVRPEKFDIGDIIATREIKILGDDNRLSLTQKAADVGASLLLEVLQDLDKFLALKQSQEKSQISYGRFT